MSWLLFKNWESDTKIYLEKSSWLIRVACVAPREARHAAQVAKIIDQLLGQYTITILGRYSKMALGQYSFLENSVDIGYWYRPNNGIVIYPISPEYCVNIDFILSCPLKEHWLDTLFLILKSQYWLDTQKYHRTNIHFWKIRLILEKYIDPIIVLSFSKLRL